MLFAELQLPVADQFVDALGDLVTLASRVGRTTMHAQLADRMPVGVVYTTFHHPVSGANVVTTTVTNITSGSTTHAITSGLTAGRHDGMICFVLDSAQGTGIAPEGEASIVDKNTATRIDFAKQYPFSTALAANDDLDVSNYLSLSDLAKNAQGPNDYRWNTSQLKKWVSNAPGQKDMAPDDLRGMLPFPALTDQQLDQLSAYLATLD